MRERRWRSIPSSKMAAWREVFANSPGGANVDGHCPLCNARHLHRYYQVGRKLEQVSGGQRFVAQGACWEWCSNCNTFEHYTALVPDWWESDLVVDEAKLTMFPDALDSAAREKHRELKKSQV